MDQQVDPAQNKTKTRRTQFRYNSIFDVNGHQTVARTIRIAIQLRNWRLGGLLASMWFIQAVGNALSRRPISESRSWLLPWGMGAGSGPQKTPTLRGNYRAFPGVR